MQARRRYLRSLLASAQRLPSSSSTQRSKRQPRRPIPSAPTLNVVPGYSVLVLDTNILLSSLSIVASIIESLRWTVVIPVPVIMELDGLCSNTSQLGETAQEAVAYITSHIRSHATSLKVQTSKGNYLTSVSIRTEQVEFSDAESWDRCMDDLILKAAIWQDEHWIDRSALLKNAAASRDTNSAVKVVLLSLDRNRALFCLVFSYVFDLVVYRLQYGSRLVHGSYPQQARRTWLPSSLVGRNKDGRGRLDVLSLINLLIPPVIQSVGERARRCRVVSAWITKLLPMARREAVLWPVGCRPRRGFEIFVLDTFEPYPYPYLHCIPFFRVI